MLLVAVLGVNVFLILPPGRAVLTLDGSTSAMGQTDNPHEVLVVSGSSVNTPADGDFTATVSISTTEDSFVSSVVTDSDALHETASEASNPMYIKERSGKTVQLSEFTHHDRFSGKEPLRMIDVSSNQGQIDWAAVAESDVDVAMIRIGYRGRMNGKLYEDPMYEYNLSEAYRHGIPFGVYIYSQAIDTVEAEEEALFVLDRIKGYELALPIAMDFEHESKSVYGKPGGRLYMAKLSRDDATLVVRAFCHLVTLRGHDAMVYANKDMLTRGIRADQLSEDYRIWLACYAKESGYDGEYSGWQYTDRGIVNGINGYVCLDFWYE